MDKHREISNYIQKENCAAFNLNVSFNVLCGCDISVAVIIIGQCV